MLKISLSSFPNLEIVDAVSSGEAALRASKELSPDVVLMDIELGSEPNGIATAKMIREANPKTGIVILSVHKDKEYISRGKCKTRRMNITRWLPTWPYTSQNRRTP